MATLTMALPKPRLAATKIKDIDKYIGGIVSRLINCYQIDNFKFEFRTRGSDYREDMMQTARLAVLLSQSRHPEKSKDAPYIKTVIINALLKDEERGRARRLRTENTIDEATPPQFEAEGETAAMEAKHDVERLIEKADLTDSERVCVELKYGFGRGEDIGECNVAKIAQLTGRGEGWVKARLTAAQIKLEVATE